MYGCGFESIHQRKNVDFSIIKFETKGEKKISKYLTLYLSGLQKNQNANRSYEIVTNSTINKKITSKNSRGEAQNHSIEVIVEVTVKQNSKIIKVKNFVEKNDYASNSNKFELKQYEKLIIDSLSEKIIDKINFFISSIE